MIFSFAESVAWDEEHRAVKVPFSIGDLSGNLYVTLETFRSLLGSRPTPAQCVEAYHLYRAHLERAAETKARPPIAGFEENDDLILHPLDMRKVLRRQPR